MNAIRTAALLAALAAALPAAAAHEDGNEYIKENGYKGPATCEECHPGTAKAVTQTVHWTHRSSVPNVGGVDPRKPTGMYCPP